MKQVVFYLLDDEHEALNAEIRRRRERGEFDGIPAQFHRGRLLAWMLQILADHDPEAGGRPGSAPG